MLVAPFAPQISDLKILLFGAEVLESFLFVNSADLWTTIQTCTPRLKDRVYTVNGIVRTKNGYFEAKSDEDFGCLFEI
jgi:hypothetical protein